MIPFIQAHADHTKGATSRRAHLLLFETDRLPLGGGKNQLLLTTEYQIPLVDLREYRFFDKIAFSLGLKLALFADQGVAWSEGDDFGANRSRSGVGAGLRLLMPGIDVLRLDFAYGEGGEWMFHLAGRPKMVSQRGRVR